MDYFSLAFKIQLNDQVFPFGVAGVDKCDFFRTAHIFHLVFALDGGKVVGEYLEIYTMFAVVFVCE